jgi:hypothetical protein
VKVGDVSLAFYYTLNSTSVGKFFNSFKEVETGKKKQLEEKNEIWRMTVKKKNPIRLLKKKE